MDENELHEEYTEEELEIYAHVEPISYFGTDFDVHGLVRRLNQKDIIVPNFDPASDGDGNLLGFQRKFVWSKLQKDRFIESMLLGFPVPDIFLVQQKDKTLLVLDGQQRLKTLQLFYSGSFALDSVVNDYKGMNYLTLGDEQRRTLDNTFIHATVIRHSDSPSGAESIYSIFERLNAGGTKLHPHEIRVALYNGPLVAFIRDLNSNPDWRHLYGSINNRLRDQELILRFIALFLDHERYERPLKSFLNGFLHDHRYLEGLDTEKLREVFVKTCEAIRRTLDKKAFRAKSSINSALVDAIMIGMSFRLEKGPVNNAEKVKEAFHDLLKNPSFDDSITRATADEERVEMRIRLAIAAFENV